MRRQKWPRKCKKFPLRSAAPKSRKASLLLRKVTPFTGQPSPSQPGLQPSLPWFYPPPQHRLAPARPLERLGVLAPSADQLSPLPELILAAAGLHSHCIQSTEGLASAGLKTVPAAKAVSLGQEPGLAAGPGTAPLRARAPTPAPEELRGSPGRAEGRSARAPSAPSRAHPCAPARRPAGPPRPAAPPPPRALRSRDVRAAGPGTRCGTGRRAETDPGSVQAGSEWERLCSTASSPCSLTSSPLAPPSGLTGDR